MAEVLRLRKHLSGPQPEPVWPAGIDLLPVGEAAPEALHAILESAYANGFGSVSAFSEWWPSIVADKEYDPNLLIIAADAGQPVGLCLCWTGGFIKDVVVTEAWRGRGIARALLQTAFHACQQRGLDHVDLKVMAGNHAATRLYHRAGMVNVPL